MTPRNGTTIDLTVTTVSVPMSVDNIVDKSVLTRAPVETHKQSFQPAYNTSSFSIYTLITDSISALSPISELAVALK